MISKILDPLVVPMVEFFNGNGLKTVMSCQGHNKTNMSMFWVKFDNSVSEEDIMSFMQKHLDQRGQFVSCGRFAKRMFGGYSVIDQSWVKTESWCYFAATVEAADEDLRRWKCPSEWAGIFSEEYLALCSSICQKARKQL